MFDSDNIPLITRVEASPGINVAFKVNSNGEGVYTVKIDSDYIGTIVSKETAAALNSVDAARLLKIESLLGISTTTTTGTGTGTGTTTTGHKITYTHGSSPISTLTSPLVFRWKIISFDGDAIVDKTATISTGSTRESVMQIFALIVKNTTSAQSYLNTWAYNTSDNSISYAFKSSFTAFAIEITVTSTSDNSAFTVT